jgi:beta-galactosidase
MQKWMCATMMLVTVASMSRAAESPQEARWGKEPVEAVSRTRGQIVLNGVWRFQPAAGEAAKEPTGNWGYINVPGDWRNTDARPGLASKGTGAAWADYKGDDVAAAWYERKVLVPREWEGRAILLDFHRVSTDAVVFVNGKKCGTLAWPGNVGSVDITSAVTPGQMATLRLLVAATGDEPEAKKFRDSGDGQAVQKKSALEARGLIGEVAVRSRPKAGAHLRDVFVRTSTRDNLLLVETELNGMKVTETTHFVARVFDETGKEQKRFERDMVANATDRQSIVVGWKWHDPKLWELGKPYLYTVKLEAKGPGLDDEMVQAFGFREFWVEGGKFFLNGREIALRATKVERPFGNPEEIAAGIDKMMQAGFNLEEHPAQFFNHRGTVDYRHLRGEVADRKGWGILAAALPVNDYILDAKGKLVWRDNNNANKKKLEQDMTLDLRRARIHPSILMWTAGVGLFGREADGGSVLEPTAWKPGNAEQDRLLRHAREAVEIMQTCDPARPVMHPRRQ